MRRCPPRNPSEVKTGRARKGVGGATLPHPLTPLVRDAAVWPNEVEERRNPPTPSLKQPYKYHETIWRQTAAQWASPGQMCRACQMPFSQRIALSA